MLLWLAACAGSGSVVESTTDGLRHRRSEHAASGSGRVVVAVPVEEGEHSMLLTAQVDGASTVHVRTVQDPSGTVVLDSTLWEASTRSRSSALSPSGLVTLNWPLAPADAPLVPGRWDVLLGRIEGTAYGPGPVSVDVHLAADPDFDAGALEVVLVYTGGLGADAALRDAMRGATERWAVLLDAVGIAVTFTPLEWGQRAPTALPGDDDSYLPIADAVGTRALAVVLVDALPGTAMGVSGGVPGPLVGTAHSAVAVSVQAAAGPDGVIDPAEEALLAETLAHESGHYLGLFHPVEASFAAWDALRDTPGCAGQADCELSLGHNLMFPYPVCDDQTGCLPQEALTADQAGVLHRNTAVR